MTSPDEVKAGLTSLKHILDTKVKRRLDLKVFQTRLIIVQASTVHAASGQFNEYIHPQTTGLYSHQYGVIESHLYSYMKNNVLNQLFR